MQRTGDTARPAWRHAMILGAVIAVVAVVVVFAARAGADSSRSPSSASSSSPSVSPSTSVSPTSSAVTSATAAQRKRWGRFGYDRSYKADLLEQVKTAPDLVFLGGSRAQRFSPATLKRLTGLSGFNFAVHNCRPTDAYAISRYLIARSPATKLHCVFAIQATTLVDKPLDQAVLYDRRFSQWFPTDLIRHQKKALGNPKKGHVPSADVYGARGNIISNAYDRRVASGVSLQTTLQGYLASMLPRAASKPSAGSSVSKFYLRKLLQLYNSRGVTPLLVIMPYHPKVLSAFRGVGWQAKVRSLKRYLAKLQKRYDVRVLDYTDISSFGGKACWFYDGAHITRQNSDRILARAIRDAPECFE